MKLIKLLTISTLFTLSACQFAPAAVATATQVPLATATLIKAPSATLTPSETATIFITPTNPPDVFGALSTADVQMSFTFEPIVAEVFDNAMGAYVDSGSLIAFEIDNVIVYYNQDGSATAEVHFSVQTTNFGVWYEDGGVLADDNWINEKCSYFDFIVTAEQYILKNRRSCS